MHTCGGCTTRWTGEKIAHCASCHESYSTPSNFDRHRHNGKCIANPKGLVKGKRGYWVAEGRHPFGDDDE